ncbi:MAG: LysM peptidoglycan-binding domain-containing protein [Bacillota bacterium]
MKKAIVTVTTTAILSTGFIAHASASTHKVEAGDSLWSISKKYNTNVSELKVWNNLTKDVIFPNQVLKVVHTSSLPQEIISKPKSNQTISETAPTNFYIVKSGDTLGKIAGQYSIPLSELMRRNNLSNHLIFPGQKLIVSNSSSSSDTSEPTQPVRNPTSTYTVIAGDTLSHISSKLGMTIQQIKALNGLTKDTIYIGQLLKISKAAGTPTKEQNTSPVGTLENRKYTVQSGDSLSAIGNRFNVSIQDIKTWNNLTHDRITIGQILTIGNARSSSHDTSTQENEDLLSQAKLLLGTPYVWGGTTPEGFDCSGFIYFVHKQAGHTIKRYSSEGYYSRSFYVDNPKPGDLVFFENTYKKGISHLGIYIGNNQFIHAGDNGVEITSLSDSYWSSKFDGFKRFYN